MIRRRIFAFLALYGAAIGSALYWNDWEFEWISMSANVLGATFGIVWLHFHWRRKEIKMITPRKIEDTFS